MTRPNIYAENPYAAGTLAASSWDFRHAIEILATTTREAFAADARRMRAFVRKATGR